MLIKTNAEWGALVGVSTGLFGYNSTANDLTYYDGTALRTVTTNDELSTMAYETATDYLTVAAAGTTYIPLTQKGAPNGIPSLDAGGLIPENQLPASSKTTVVVADIAARDAIAAGARSGGMFVHVLDASSDATVVSGGATYVLDGDETTWHKVSEFESLDQDLTVFELTSNKSTDGTFASASDNNYASELAVKTYVDNQIGQTTAVYTKSAAFQLLASEVNSNFNLSGVSTYDITVPLEATESIPIGSIYTLRNGNDIHRTIAPEGGVTLHTRHGESLVLPQNSTAILRKTATNDWTVSGELQEEIYIEEKLDTVYNGRFVLRYGSMHNYSGTITEVRTRCDSGTVTATFDIASTSLGGTANSVSSSVDVKQHTANNVLQPTQEIGVTFSSNSNAQNIVVAIKLRRN